MRSPRHPVNARAALLWGVLGFVGAQLAIGVALEVWHPGVHDEEFDVRLAELQNRRAETPERPLLLCIGSSRTVISFRPEQLPPLETSSGQQPLVFNFSHLGAGPLMNLVELRRLLRRGIRPDWLVLEIMPPCLSFEGHAVAATGAEVRDLPVLTRYLPTTHTLGIFARSHLLPCCKHRGYLLRQFAPMLDLGDGRPDWAVFRVGRLGDNVMPLLNNVDFDPATRQRHLEWTRAGYYPKLQQFSISPVADRALRETLKLCRKHRVRVALLLSPEASEFRAWYPAGAVDQVTAYGEQLGRAHGVSVIDARQWLPDTDFWDGHHVVPHGARSFTQQLGREVLTPLVRGRL